jgi:lysophospholipase L1-like esterase
MRNRYRCLWQIAFIYIYLLTVGGSSAWCENIIAYGDSITSGHPYIPYYPGGARVGGYEPKLEVLLNNAGAPSQVLNYGYPGEITTAGVNRIDSILAANPNAAHILLLEGTNDVNAGISPYTTAYNMGVMIDKSQARHVKPIIGTMLPIPNANVAASYNPSIKQIASQKGALLADLYAAIAPNWGALSINDRLHPNNSGYQVMAQTWFDSLFISGGDVTVIGSGGGFTVYTWDASDGLSGYVNSQGDLIQIGGTRTSWIPWGQGDVNYQVGVTKNALLPESGKLEFDIVATGYDSALGAGTGYKAIVQFWNDTENYIAMGLIHDPGVSPDGVTVMVEGAADTLPVGGFWGAGMPSMIGESHHFSIAWAPTQIICLIDNMEVYRLVYNIKMNHPSLSFIGAARLPGDTISVEFRNIIFNLEAHG